MFYEYEDSDIKNYADGATPYNCALDTDAVISKLQSTFDKLSTWFKNSYMKANPESWHYLLSSKTPAQSLFGGSSVKCSTKETLLGVLIDFEVCFDEPISLISTKVSRK